MGCPSVVMKVSRAVQPVVEDLQVGRLVTEDWFPVFLQSFCYCCGCSCQFVVVGEDGTNVVGRAWDEAC